MANDTKYWARKALGSVLEDLAVAEGIVLPNDPTKGAIQWGAAPLDVANMGLERYLRFTNHPNRQRVTEIGPTPRIEQGGFAKIGIFTQLDLFEDENDLLAAKVRSAFPYNAEFTKGGIRVNITTVDDGDTVPDRGYYYAPVDIHWMIWRV